MRRVVVVAGIVGMLSVAQAVTVEQLLGGGRLVAYTPLGFDPASDTAPRAATLAADADSLYRVGIRAVTTYGSSRALAPVCRFFKRRGIRTVLAGVWDPRDASELGRARALRRCADGYVVGSQGLGGRYTREELATAMRRLRQSTGRPVTTRESLATYAGDPDLVRLGDWVFPSIDPWGAGHRDGQDACGWTIAAYRDVAARAPAGIAVVIAETGLPTEGAGGTSEFYQRAFFYCLESRQVAFAHFEAFDQPWKTPDDAKHRGLFRSDGSPKLWAAQQIRPVLTAGRARRSLHGRVRGAPLRGVQVVAYANDGRWTRMAATRVGRRGKWSLDAPSGAAVTIYVASAAWAPPEAVDRLPVVDRVLVLARQDVPAM